MLKKYRDVVWSLELSVKQVQNKFQIEYGSSIEDFLESVYLAGADLSGSEVEHHAQCIDQSYKMLKLMETAIEVFSSILWGYTSQDSLALLEQFFPKLYLNLGGTQN